MGDFDLGLQSPIRVARPESRCEASHDVQLACGECLIDRETAPPFDLVREKMPEGAGAGIGRESVFENLDLTEKHAKKMAGIIAGMPADSHQGFRQHADW